MDTLNDDLRHLPHDLGAFQMLTGDQCVIAACLIAVYAWCFI